MSKLPDNWQATTSGELCEYITSGSRDWKSYYSNTGPLFVRTQDINKDRLDLSEVAHVNLPEKVEGKRSRIHPGDLLVTVTGANVGKVALVPTDIPEAYVSQSVGLMRLKDKRHGQYLHYYLQSDQTGRKQVLNLVYGIGRPVLSLQNLRDIPVALPPLPEQRRIVAEIEKQFTRLEAGVAALRRVQANLKRYRAAVLKAACEGKLVKGDTSKWKSEQLGKLVTIRYGKMLPTKELSKSGFPVFGANGIIGHHTRFLYEEEQVLISCRGAYSGKINLSPAKCFITNNSLVLEMPERPQVTKRFLFYALQAVDKSKMVTGSAQPQVTINNAEVAEVPVPPLAEQTRIVAEVERRLSVVEELESVVSANLQRATRLRQSILQKAFTGQLT